MRKIKNLFLKSVTFLLLLTIIGPVPLPAFAQASQDEIWHYEIMDEEYISIVDEEGYCAYYGSEEVLEIPSEIDGYIVKEIGPYALYNCGISEISIPDTVTGIAENAFDGNDDIVIKSSCGSYVEKWAKNKGFEFLSNKHSYEAEGICVGKDDVIEAGFDLAISSSNNSIDICWDEQENASYYDLYRKEDDSSFNKIATVISDNYTDNPTANSNVSYSLLAYDENGECIASSNTAKIFIPRKASLTITNTNAGMQLSWAAVNGADKYIVYMKKTDGSYTKLSSQTDTTYTYASAESGNKYTYMVETYAGKIKSQSLDKSLIFLSSIKPTLAITVDGVNLSWTAVSGAKGYTIYRKAAGESKYTVLSKTTLKSYEDKTAVSGTMYYYAVRAYNGSVMGYYTASKTTFLSSPVMSINTSLKGVNIHWNKVNGAEGYYVYRKEIGGKYKVIATVTDNSYLDPATFNAKTYLYAVRAYIGTIRSCYYEETIKLPPYAGIDVSRYNGNINFAKAKADGIDFVMIRCGTSYGHTYNKDIRFDDNYRNAKKAGLLVGAYFYSYALTTAQAKTEANWCMKMIEGKSFEYPIAFDIEDHTQEKLSMAQLSAIIKTFCDTLEANGYKVCVYSSLNWYKDKINSTVKDSYDLWVAQWYKECTLNHEYTLWQYTSSGSVNGISGRVDLDWGYTDYEKTMAEGGYNGYAKDPDSPNLTLTNTLDGIQLSWEAVKGAGGYYIYRGSGIGYYSLLATSYDGIKYLDSDVKSGTSYKYKIVPINGDSETSYPEKTIVCLSTPEIKLANAVWGSKITWSKVDGASGYYIYRKVEGGSYSRIKKIDSGSVTSYYDTTAESGTKYIYAVKAYSGKTMSAFTYSDLFRLSSASLSLTNTAKGINLSWTKVSGAESYYIYRKETDGSYSRIAKTSSLTYLDETTKSGVSYTYAVRAYADGFLSSYEEVEILRLDAPSISLNNKEKGIKISWAKVAGAKGYIVYRKAAGENSYTKLGSGTNLYYTDKTAKAGVTYTYAVKAYNGTYKSAYLAAKTIRLTEPTLTLSNTKSGPKAQWTKVSGAGGYYVYRKTSTGSYSKIATTKSLSYVDKTAKKGTKYTYAVRAYNGNVRSSYTEVSIKCVK